MGIFDFFLNIHASKQGISEDKRDEASCQKPFTSLGIFSSCAKTDYLYRCLITHQISLAALYFENCTSKPGICFCCYTVGKQLGN